MGGVGIPPAMQQRGCWTLNVRRGDHRLGSLSELLTDFWKTTWRASRPVAKSARSAMAIRWQRRFGADRAVAGSTKHMRRTEHIRIDLPLSAGHRLGIPTMHAAKYSVISALVAATTASHIPHRAEQGLEGRASDLEFASVQIERTLPRPL